MVSEGEGIEGLLEEDSVLFQLLAERTKIHVLYLVYLSDEKVISQV